MEISTTSKKRKLDELPQEVLLHIIKYLPKKLSPTIHEGGGLLSLCLVNKKFNRLTTPELYRTLIIEYDNRGFERHYVESLLLPEHSGLQWVRNVIVRRRRQFYDSAGAGRVSSPNDDIVGGMKIGLVSMILYRLRKDQLQAISFDSYATAMTDAHRRVPQTKIQHFRLSTPDIHFALSKWRFSGIFEGVSRDDLFRRSGTSDIALSLTEPGAMKIFNYYANKKSSQLLSLSMGIGCYDSYATFLGLLVSNKDSLRRVRMFCTSPVLTVQEMLLAAGDPAAELPTQDFVKHGCHRTFSAVEELQVLGFEQFNKVLWLSGLKFEAPNLKSLMLDKCSGINLTALRPRLNFGSSLKKFSMMECFETFDLSPFLLSLEPQLQLLAVHLREEQGYPTKAAILHHKSTLRYLWLEVTQTQGRQVLLPGWTAEGALELDLTTLLHCLQLRELAVAFSARSLDTANNRAGPVSQQDVIKLARSLGLPMSVVADPEPRFTAKTLAHLQLLRILGFEGPRPSHREMDNDEKIVSVAKQILKNDYVRMAASARPKHRVLVVVIGRLKQRPEGDWLPMNFQVHLLQAWENCLHDFAVQRFSASLEEARHVHPDLKLLD